MAKSFISDRQDIGKYCSRHRFFRPDVHYDRPSKFIFQNNVNFDCVIALNREESVVLYYSYDVSTFETFFKMLVLCILFII